MLSEIYDEGIREFGTQGTGNVWKDGGYAKRYSLAHDLSSDQQGEVYSWKNIAYSLCRFTLAKEIQNTKHDCSCDILVEVNIAGEESKFGTSRDEAISLVEEIAKLTISILKDLWL